MSTDAPGTGAPPSPVVSRKRVAPSLSDADRELIEQLRPERERRGLNLNQAATQIGIEWGSYRHLESGQVRVLRASARDKVRAWLDLSVIHEPADAEPDPALEQQIDEWQADQDGDEPADTDVIVKAYVFREPALPDAPAAPAVTLADVLAYLPEFDSRWSDAVALRWFDAFDALAHLIATEALP